jgi:D-alanyl-lipoteichoic acid acyltransferase DltB (MBOAT superfamily)
MLWGFFKKVVIADNLAVYVDTVYNNPQAWDGLNLIIAAIFFSFQVYCDFSGYSDIAIGAAEVLGFKLMTNFNRPFHAKSISELWQRWHISLTSWFKDYLYIPLGGSRGSKGSWYFNIMFVFFISGVWHGAAWTYIIWGFLNGFFILFSIWTVTLRNNFTKLIGLTRFPLFHRFVKTLCTFGLFTYSLIFFRANSMFDVLYIHKAIVLAIIKPSTISGNSPVSTYQFIVCIGAIVVLELIHYSQSKRDMRESWANKPIWIRWAIYYAFILAIYFFGEFSNRQFVYFQF